MIVQEMTIDECYEFLKQRSFGRLGCARENQPYVVPIYFAFDGKHLYCFATVGQKIEWMRANPLVCLEVDDVVSHLDWRSVVVLGKFEELCDKPPCPCTREYALELLQRRPMWWQPAYVAVEHRGSPDALNPVFYRIRIDQVTGHHAIRDSFEEAASKVVAGIKAKSKWHLFSRWLMGGQDVRETERN